MNCHDIQNLYDPYLDSELDARTAAEIERHLRCCPECARLVAEEEKLEASLKAGLSRGERTPALWEQIEQSVAAVGRATARPLPTSPGPRAAAWLGMVSALRQQIRACWRRSRWAWSGLAAAWALILGLNFTAREPATLVVAAQSAPSLSEIRLACQQKRLLMADLSVTTEPAPANKTKATPPGPRGERPREMLNS
jgi:anti-sigma factor RsiW